MTSVGSSILTALGAGSGIDTSSLVSSLVSATRDPKESAITTRQSLNTSRISALASAISSLDTFADALAHIEWAKWADVVCLAPLSANTLGKLACGLADDALTTVAMAIPRGVRVVLGPAMNTEMWHHPAVQANLSKVLGTGRAHLVEPVSKRLACGDIGPGGLADPETLLAACTRLYEDLEGTPRVVLG